MPLELNSSSTSGNAQVQAVLSARAMVTEVVLLPSLPAPGQLCGELSLLFYLRAFSRQAATSAYSPSQEMHCMVRECHCSLQREQETGHAQVHKQTATWCFCRVCFIYLLQVGLQPPGAGGLRRMRPSSPL